MKKIVLFGIAFIFLISLVSSQTFSGNELNVGTVKLFPLFSKQKQAKGIAIGFDFERYVDKEIKDFDRVLIKNSFMDYEINEFDPDRVVFVGSVEYYLVPLVSSLDSGLIILKPNTEVEFWKDGKL